MTRQELVTLLNRTDLDLDPNQDIASQLQKVYVADNNGHVREWNSSRSQACVRGRETRRTASSLSVKLKGKRYAWAYRRTDCAGVVVPTTFVSKHLQAYPGDEVLVVGSRGIKPTNLTVRKDGSIYLNARMVRNARYDHVLIRPDNGNLVVKTTW